ncbi:MAG: tetratricopeptide repeat protein [Deltaproteobacteria bacterium]
MRPAEKDYILRHAGTMPAAEIARHLGLKERKVRRFLEGRGRNAPDAGAPPRRGAGNVLLPAVLIALLGAAAYANSLGGQFIWDDEHLVQNNVYIRNPAHFAGLFTKKDVRKEYAFYRPLQEASYMADYALWKGHAAGYHLTNVVLHILTALCVFWLLSLLFARPALSLIAACLFVVHPVHTEAVAYISGRADAMAALFMLLSFIFYVKQAGPPAAAGDAGRPPQRAFAPLLFTGTLISYAAALLSRENSLILPFLLTFYCVLFRVSPRRGLRVAGPFFAVWGLAGLYVLLRLTALRFFLTLPQADTSVGQRLPGSFAALAEYLRLLVLPFGLHMEYGMGTFPWTDPRVPAGIALLAGLILYAVRKGHRSPLAAFSIGWFLLTLLPQANIIPVNAYMSEHWLYLPSIGFCALAAGGLDLLKSRRGLKAALAATAVLILYFGALTLRQNAVWNDPIVFYRQTLAYAPRSARLLNNLGILMYKKGRAQEAADLFRRAIAAEPDYIEAYNDLGNLYKDAGKLDEAQALFKKAIGLDPHYAEAYNNLAIVAFFKGSAEKAIPLFEKAIALRPDFGEAYYNLAAALFRQKKFGLAARYYGQAEALGTSNAGFAQKLAEALRAERE